MSENEAKKLQEVLEGLKLQKYYVNFQKEEILLSDLEHISEDDLREFIPSKFHLKRLLIHLSEEKTKKKKRREKEIPDTTKRGRKGGEEEMVQMFVKCEQKVENVYDVPLDSTNEELVGKLVQTFMGPCQVKLQGEERELAASMKSFTLRKWFDKNERSHEDTIRAVLNVKWPTWTKSDEEVKKLKKEVDDVKSGSKVELGEISKRLEKEKRELKSVEREKERWRRQCESNAKKCAELERKLAGCTAEIGSRKLNERISEAQTYFYGLNGVSIDYSLALRICHEIEKEAEERGEEVQGRVLNMLDVMYKHGRGVKKDPGKSRIYQRRLLKFYSSKKLDDLEPEDCRIVGMMHLLGIGFPKNYHKAFRHIKRAADRGNVVALDNLGYCYDVGIGVPKNVNKAIEVYARAAESGTPTALCNYGSMLEAGCGVEKDVKRGFNLYDRAARRGYILGMHYVGNCFRNGRGCVKNVGEAKKWFRRAAQLGHEESKTVLSVLKRS